jgi:hypothetical protein
MGEIQGGTYSRDAQGVRHEFTKQQTDAYLDELLTKIGYAEEAQRLVRFGQLAQQILNKGAAVATEEDAILDAERNARIDELLKQAQVDG